MGWKGCGEGGKGGWGKGFEGKFALDTSVFSRYN